MKGSLDGSFKGNIRVPIGVIVILWSSVLQDLGRLGLEDF